MLWFLLKNNEFEKVFITKHQKCVFYWFDMKQFVVCYKIFLELALKISLLVGIIPNSNEI